MDVREDPDATLALDDALKTLYLRVALIGHRVGAKHPAYFHLVKAAHRLERAWRATLAERAGRN